MEARNGQVDGNHYAKLEYQPFEFAMDMAGTPGLCKVAKYLSRNKGDRLTNLKKAYHVIQLEQEWHKKNDGGDWVAIDGLTLYEENCIEKFCSQFQHKEVYSTILTMLFMDKFGKAKENLTKFVKYQRWEYI